MSNTRKLRPFRTAVITTSGRTSVAYPAETCVYHPDCCDPDDFTCTGCGQPAAGVVTYQINGREQRWPFCGEHEAGMMICVEGMALHAAGEAN